VGKEDRLETLYCLVGNGKSSENWGEGGKPKEHQEEVTGRYCVPRGDMLDIGVEKENKKGGGGTVTINC